MITLHCQHKDGKTNHKCGIEWMGIQNGCVMVISVHNGEKHTNVLRLEDLIRLAQEDERRREPALQV